MEPSLLDLTWIILCAGIVFLMQAGFLCLESGLTRSKNSINVAAKNVTDLGVSAFCYWLFGFGLMFGASWGGWVGTTHFCTRLEQGEAWLAAFFLFQLMFCGTATTIFSGAVAERMRFRGYVVAAAVLSGLIYPVFGHWAWGADYLGNPGWLAQQGFVDFAGSTVVHSVGGWVALAAVLVIGPRSGRFPEKGPPRAIPGHNLPVACLGALLLWLGWFGFNGGSTLAMNDQVPLILANTMLAAVAGLMTALGWGWITSGKPAVPSLINGSLAGLVAITAGCHAVGTGDSVLIGAIGAATTLVAERLLERLRIDDVVGAFPVHTVAGLWGTVAVGLWGDLDQLGTGLGRSEQVVAQLLGMGVCAVWSFGGAYLVLLLLNRLTPLRVSPEVEHVGLNVAEHGATTEILDLFQAMERQARSGDLSLRVPVEPFTEVGQLAERYNRVMDSLENAATQLKNANQRLAHDLQAAARVQQSLLPRTAPPIHEAKFAWHYRPCHELAGDILNVFQLGPEHVGVYVADVSGHGVAASLLSVAINRMLTPEPTARSLVIEPQEEPPGVRVVPPREVAQELNRRFPMEETGDQYFTIVYGVLDLAKREFRYVSAGHPPMVHWRQGREPQVLHGEGFVIGWDPTLEFEEHVIPLESGDRLCLYSDGVVDASNGTAEPFGQHRLVEVIRNTGSASMEDSLKELLQSVERWCGLQGVGDDISLVGIELH